MIENWQGQYVPICDCCRRSLPAAEDFREAMDRMKANEWLFVEPNPEKGLDDGLHLCPKCGEGITWK